jgi:hypothetical protein
VTPLEAPASELLSVEGFGLVSSRDLDVVNTFVIGLVVRLLL